MVDFVMVPGLHGSGPGHWQTLWEPMLSASRVVQHDWSTPALDQWADAVARHLESRRRPAVLIAHSLGCLAVASAWSRIRHQVGAVLFAAPANPHLFGFQPIQQRIEAPSLLLASRNDHWLAFEDAQQLAVLWGSELVDLGPVGHINIASGHGGWPEGHRLLGRLLDRAGLPCPPILNSDGSDGTRRAAGCV